MHWFIIPKFSFFTHSLQLCVVFTYLFITPLSYIMYIMHSCSKSYINGYLFLMTHFFKLMIFNIKTTFETKAFKCVIKMDFTNFNPFSLLIINIRILSNLEKEWWTFDKENRHLKIVHPWILSASSFLKHHQFSSNFEYGNFASNGTYFQIKLTIQIIVLTLWFFKYVKL